MCFDTGWPTVRPRHYPSRTQQHPEVIAARYRLRSKTLPPSSYALLLGEIARVAMMALFGRANGGALSATFSGRSEAGPLKGHRHAHYLPTDEDRDGMLDHLTIFAAAGFDSLEQTALSRLEYLSWGHQGKQEGSSAEGSGGIALAYEGLVSLADVPAFPLLFGPAQLWRSTTPFVLTRYPKQYRDGRPKLNDDGRQIDGPEDQVLQEWRRRRAETPSLPRIARIDRLKHLEFANGQQVAWTDFRRQRTRGGGRSADFAYGFEIEFEQPVRRHPIALGYACHFGLGQFAAVVA